MTDPVLSPSPVPSPLAVADDGPTIGLHRGEGGWLASCEAIDLCSEWATTPEAALVGLVDAARAEHGRIGRLPSGVVVGDGLLEKRWAVLSRWFAA